MLSLAPSGCQPGRGQSQCPGPAIAPAPAGQVRRGRAGTWPQWQREVCAVWIMRSSSAPGPPFLLHQPPGLVEQLGGRQRRVGDAAGSRRALGGRHI